MLLKTGSKGDDVKKLQKALGLKADGDFGPGTQLRVKAWQKEHGLKADGIVGDTTWGILFKQPAATTPPILLTPPTPLLNIIVPGIQFKLDKFNGQIPPNVIEQIPDTALKFGIENPLRLAHLLAQCGHESGGFKLSEENLNYTAPRLCAVFPKRFTPDIAKGYSRKPEMIGNRAYALKNGNGDEASGDGYKFRGRGFIQLTGRSNYAAFDAYVEDDILANPDLVASKYALASAAFYFKNNNLWNLCDKGNTEKHVQVVTRRVNGPAMLGLSERQQLFRKYYSNLL